MVKTRIEIFPDIEPLIDFFEELPEYDVAMYTHKKMKTTTASSLEVLKELLPIFEELTDYSNDSLYKTLLAYVEQKGCKNGYAMWPVRTAVSGKQMTPAGATEIMEIIGKEESLKRIRKGIELLEMPQNKKMIPSPAQQGGDLLRGRAPCWCLPAPGSGKTAVITQRIRYLVEERHIKPSDILTITFTKSCCTGNEAAGLSDMPGRRKRCIWNISFCFFQIIRSSSKFQNYSIMTEQQKLQILRPLLKGKKLDCVQMSSFCEQFYPISVFTKIPDGKERKKQGRNRQCKNKQCKNKQGKIRQSKCSCMSCVRLTNSAVENDGCLILMIFLIYCYRLLTEDSGLRDRWENRFRYILIDEFQDINDVQYQIIKLLSANYENLFVVGDDDQAIYSFRGLIHPICTVF